jgi:hypothetical protein
MYLDVQYTYVMAYQILSFHEHCAMGDKKFPLNCYYIYGKVRCDCYKWLTRDKLHNIIT